MILPESKKGKTDFLQRNVFNPNKQVKKFYQIKINMKALSHTIQKLMANVEVFFLFFSTSRQTDKQTGNQTGQKTIRIGSVDSGA